MTTLLVNILKDTLKAKRSSTTSSKRYSSSTRLLHDPFISSNVGPVNSSGVKVSTLSRFITNAEKSRGVSISSLNDFSNLPSGPKSLAKVEQVHEHPAKSCSNHDREKEVLLVSKTNQGTKGFLH
ncbi:hypothetical protein Tco_1173725 [Tanacetum coccineum]